MMINSAEARLGVTIFIETDFNPASDPESGRISDILKSMAKAMPSPTHAKPSTLSELPYPSISGILRVATLPFLAV